MFGSQVASLSYGLDSRMITFCTQAVHIQQTCEKNNIHTSETIRMLHGLLYWPSKSLSTRLIWKNTVKIVYA